MSRKYLWAILGFTAGALAVLVGMAAVLFSRDLDDAQRKSRQRMLAMAAYVEEHVAASALTGEGPGDDELDTWLRRLCAASGFERIVVADSLGLAYWSSQPMIARGDDIMPYVIDHDLFRRAGAGTAPCFTRHVKLDNVSFMSLYFPCRIAGEAYVLVLESDQQYFAASERFRSNLLLILAAVVVLFAALGGCLVLVGRRARKAHDLSRRNEHLAFLGTASAELAHELKNPLAIVKASVDVLRKKFDPGATQRAFDFVSEEIMRLSRLINDILNFSRQQALTVTSFSPAAVMEATGEALAVASPDIALHSSIPGDLLINGDKDCFVQIADNLIRNAVAAMGARGMISVTFEQKGRAAHLAFHDGGPGIPDEIKHTIFEPFVSGSKTGTGLGLALVKTLCERNGWEIELTSSRPRATTFTLILPDDKWQRSSS